MINLAVIGVGIMGTNHVRVLSGMPGINLAAISDMDKEKLDAVALKFNVKNKYLDHKEMLQKEKLDGVIIAVPAAVHRKVALDCAERGVHILLEKPIAHKLEDAQDIISKVNEKSIVFLVGHIERFNPVVTKIKELIDSGLLGEIYLINSIRVGPFPKRLYGLQEGVLIDISIHDIDIMRHLVGEISQVYSQLIFSGKQEVYAKSLFKFTGGVKGTSEFSWISPKRSRIIEVYGFKGMLRGDYFSQELVFYENSDKETENAITKGNISAGPMINYPINKEEPLLLELMHFIECIKNNKKPRVNIHDATRALEVALSILKSGNSDHVVNI